MSEAPKHKNKGPVGGRDVIQNQLEDFCVSKQQDARDRGWIRAGLWKHDQLDIKLNRKWVLVDLTNVLQGSFTITGADMWSHRVHPRNYAYGLWFVVFYCGLVFMIDPCHAGLLHRHWDNHMIAPVPGQWDMWSLDLCKIPSVCSHFLYAPNQWEMMLQCNAVSHWLSANITWSLHAKIALTRLLAKSLLYGRVNDCTWYELGIYEILWHVEHGFIGPWKMQLWS